MRTRQRRRPVIEHLWRRVDRQPVDRPIGSHAAVFFGHLRPVTNPRAAPAPPSAQPRSLEFGGLRIRWDHRVLEPRPWTIAQPEWLAELSADTPDGPALELCCGAGHMGLVLARLTGRPLVQVDVNPVAIDFARANAEAAGVPVDLRENSMTAALGPDEQFALVLADPPWVPARDIGEFPEDPLVAIDGGDDGLDVARECLAVTARHLRAGGHAVLQLGTEEQADRLWSARVADRLELVGVRRCERGVLVHLRA